MNLKLRGVVLGLMVIAVGAASGFYALAKIRPPSEKLARPHSVIYVERTYQSGKLIGERIILRTVNARGEHQKEEIWPKLDARPMRLSSEGLSSVAPDGAMTTLSKEVGASLDTLRPLSESSKGKASEVRTIAGLKAWVFKSGEQSSEVEWDRALAPETGSTPLWSHITIKRTGKEVVSEALRVIWGTQEKD